MEEVVLTETKVDASIPRTFLHNDKLDILILSTFLQGE